MIYGYIRTSRAAFDGLLGYAEILRGHSCQFLGPLPER